MTTKTILIADDEPMVLRILRLQLEKAGFTVETAPNGEIAFARIMETQPDVLITDIEMPRMTGEELCKKLHQDLPSRHFPIFVTTSLTGLRHREWSTSIPNLFFLEKPTSARRLLAALEDVFSHAEAQIAPEGSCT